VIAAPSETVTLWRPTGQQELDLVAASQWREWPPRLPEQPIFYPVLNRWYATKIAREWNVPHGSVGYVTRFDVRTDYLDRFPVQQAGGRDVLEYWIPAEELREFNANLTEPIIEEARYLGPVTDEEFAQAANRLGCQFPAAWREYLQGRSWLSRGRLESGCYLTLLGPGESADQADAWQAAAQSLPGLVILGTDGGREMLAVDDRDRLSTVVLIDITAGSWEEAVPQMPIKQFIAQIEAGSFNFTWK
jgi:hypothetical protein